MAKDQIRFDLNSELKRRFQMQCLERGEKMTPVLQSLIEEWIEQDKDLEAIRGVFQALIRGERPANSMIVRTAGTLRLDTDRLLDLCDNVLPHGRKNNG